MKQLTRIITCAALLLFVTAICQAKNPTQSGVLLEINGMVTGSCDGDCPSQSVDLTVTDSAIHSGPFPCSVAGSNCRKVPIGGTGNCTANDQIATNAYVAQGGAPTGCDPGDGFETTQGTGAYTFKAAGQPGYEFDVSTIYCATPNNGTPGATPCPQTVSGVACSTSGNICIGGEGQLTDTGFVKVTNNGHSSFTGNMSLSGTPTNPSSNPISCTRPGVTLDSINFGNDSNLPALAPGDSVYLAAEPDSSNCGGYTSDTTAGDITPVSPGTTTVLLPFPQFALGQKVTLFNGTNMGGVAAMRDVLRLVDGGFCDNQISGGGEGSSGDTLFKGSPISGNATCARVSGAKAGQILNECFDAAGNQFADCSGIDPSGAAHHWVGLRSKYSSGDPDVQNPLYAYMHDDGTGATNVTIAFRNGCTTPPCGPNGGPGHLNGLATVGDQHLLCQVFPNFLITPSTARPGQSITVTGNISSCPEVLAAGATQGLLTFTFEGLFNSGDDEDEGGDDGVCRQRTISVPHLPKAGLAQGGSLIDISSTHVLNVQVKVPNQACGGGTFKLWATIIAVASDTSHPNNLFYNSSKTFTVQNGH